MTTISKEVWLAEDGNGDLHYYLEKPTKAYSASKFFWTTKSGHIVPFRGFESDLKELFQDHDVDLANTPLKVTFSIAL